jgi:hypothetical protein
MQRRAGVALSGAAVNGPYWMIHFWLLALPDLLPGKKELLSLQAKDQAKAAIKNGLNMKCL